MAVLETECEACFGSFKALATHVLRHHRQMETVSRLVITNPRPACLAVYEDRNAAHGHDGITSSWVFVVIGRVILVKVTSHFLSVVLCAPAEPGNW